MSDDVERIRKQKGIVKAVAYARFSSTNQREESIEAQMIAIQKYAADNNIEIIRTYSDHAKTGTNTDREDFQRMIKSAEKQDFDFIIVHKLDRFSRNVYKTYEYLGKLKNMNVGLLSTTGETDNSMMMGLKIIMADEYSKNLSQEVKKGLNVNARKAMFNGGLPPLGYDVDDEKHYIINAAEAEIVRMIFTMIAENNTYKDVVKELNRCGFRTKRGNVFGKNSIHDILRNPKYSGDYVYNRHAEAYFNGKKKVNNGHKYRNNGDIIKITGVIPPIISKETFDKVQEIMDGRDGIRSEHGKNHTYLLTGKIFCGECGSHYVGFSTKNHYKRLEIKYRCQGRKQKTSTFCQNKSIEAHRIEGLILGELEKIIFDKNMVDIIYERYRNIFTEKSEFHDAELRQARRDAEEIGKRMKHLMDVIEQTGNANIIAQYEERKQEKYDLEQKIDELGNKPLPKSVSKADIRKYLKRAQKLFENKKLEEMQQLVNLFVNRVTVYKEYCQIDLNYMEITKTVKAKMNIKKQTTNTGNL